MWNKVFWPRVEDECCQTKVRFLYTGNKTLWRHFRQKYEDECCKTIDRFLYTRNRTLWRLFRQKYERWVLLHQKKVSVYRKQTFKTSLQAWIWNKFCNTKDRFLYIGNRTSIRHILNRHIKDVCCHKVNKICCVIHFRYRTVYCLFKTRNEFWHKFCTQKRNSYESFRCKL